MHGNSLRLVTCIVVVALVAADNAVITMEQKESSLNELLVDDYLLLASKNTTRRTKKQEEIETLAPVPLTEHPVHAEQRNLLQGEHLFPVQKDISNWYENEKRNKWEEFKARPYIQVNQSTTVKPTHTLPVQLPEMEVYEVEDLLPTEDLEELSRDKRAAIGSGDLDTEALFTVTLDEFISVAMGRETDRKSEVAEQLTQLLKGFDVQVDTVTVTDIKEAADKRAEYSSSVTFTGSTDRQGVAYALERAWRSQTLIGSYPIYITPRVCNAADVFVNAVCLLCPASRPCTDAGVCQEFATAASAESAAFGLGEADIKLPSLDDVISDQIDIPNGMPVFGQKVKTMFLGDNGGVSLGTPYNPFFLESMQSSDVSYICIFCDDFDNRYSGSNVWYQTYPSGKSWATNMLDRLTAEVRANTDYRTFEATWASVMTWNNIPEYDTYSRIDEKGNSFQMILVTNTDVTFLLFYYMDITASQPFRENGVHGYKIISSTVELYELLYSRKPVNNNAASSIKPRMSRVKGNTGIRGKWIFRIGESEPDYTSLCFNWYLQNLRNRDNYRNRARLIGNNQCPCWRNVFQLSARFLPMAAFTNQAFFCSENRAWFGSNRDSYECCYDALGRFINRYPEAGGYHRFASFLAPYQHKLQDSDPKDWCCRKTNLCRLYQDVRPVSRCWGRRPIIILVFIVGDPHFVTLDGKTFTYNAIGEHRLLELEESDFTFKAQCRSSQAWSKSGEKVRASIFSAFAGKQTSATLGTAGFHVEMNKERTKMVIYINDVDVTLSFHADPDYKYELGHFTAYRTSENRIDFSFTQTGITMAVKLVSGALSQAISLPDTYKGKPIGLLGNYNGNPDDDFVTPSKINYQSSSTDKELFPYGKTWAIQNQESSCLHYAPGETTVTYTDNDFIPLYDEDITAEQRRDATVVCGEGKNQCIYDYAVTGNADLAKATTEQIEEAEKTNVILANRAPTISGTDQLNVEIGKPSPVQFIGDDADGNTITYVTVDQPSTGFIFDQNTGVGTFQPADDDAVNIGVAAKDSKNAQSSVMQVKIRLCRGCKNGVCNYDMPVTEAASEGATLFQVVTCNCDKGYTGDDCSVDRDGCANNPCGPTTTCKDSTPEEEVNGMQPFTCTCLSGYEIPAGGTKCENIDECQTNNGNCPANSICEDSIGSYKCTCNNGYRMNGDRTECKDIDECLEHLNDCAQTCSNTDGDFTCGCHDGYTPNGANPKACDPDSVPDGCPSTCNEDTELCVNNGTGNPKCVCKPGYELKAGETKCTDIDECKLSLCAQKCENSVGSFTCSCFSGFKLAPDNLDCLACSFPNYGDKCSSTCECQGRASECNPVNGCMCLSPWSGSTCEEDANECDLDPNICGLNGVCADTKGSYICTCKAGYSRQGNECVDINECEIDTEIAACPSNSECTNTLGSYTCACSTGYIKSGDSCADIDECTTGTAQCEHRCLNQPGSFNCYCLAGHTLNDDRITCTKDPDKTQPCEGLTNTKCSHYCDVVDSQPVCKCKRGYSLAADKTTCLDINECSDDTLNLCEEKSSCTNTPGSFTCGCPVGQKLENNGRNCADCDGSTWGVNCSTSCNCSHTGTSMCDNVRGCVCNGGWSGTLCDVDVNECATETCPANSDCVNQPGKFECQCRSGYKKSADGNTCEQIDECADSALNVCEHMCTDTDGSYYCSCRTGFILEGKGKCTDIDECAKGTNDCDQDCRNTAGSFTCQCFEGFQFTDTLRKTCTAITPQTCTKPCNTTNGGCLNGGTDTCYCNRGFNLNEDGFTCNDIKECSQNPSPCSGNCTDTDGSFTCSCDPGFYLAADETSCAACLPNKWGDNCANNCSCTAENTESCNPVDGSCTCRKGWEGALCDKDVLECDTANICGDNGVCTEQPGTYQCTCQPGYIRTDVCTQCSSDKWGDNCANTCSCDFAKTLSCDHVSGKCICRPGWTGADCTTDVDECTSEANPVCTGPQEKCENNIGSYTCGCNNGYQRSADNSACIDLDECLDTNLNTCTFECNNLNGSFTCACPRGYLGSGNDCTANFVIFVVVINLNFNRDDIIAKSNSAEYKKLQTDIASAIDALLKPLGTVNLPSAVGQLNTGSVIAYAELRIDKAQTDNELAELAKSLEKLAEVRSLDVDGSERSVTSITYKDIPILKKETVCDVYKNLRNFSGNEYCIVDENGTPVAKTVSDQEDKVPFIVGLTVGSLLFLILLTLLLIYCCCYRKPASKAPSEDRDPAFRSAFAGTLPMKGSFGATRYLMYSPHTLSDAASQVSDDSSGRRERRASRKPDFGDLPKWNQDRFPDFHERRGSDSRNDVSSDFSWGNMFSRLGQFEVPRPNVSAQQNKLHDSLA